MVSDGVDECTATVDEGSCNISLTTGGARMLTASYAGDANFNPSVSAGEPHTVNAAPGAAGSTAIPALNLWGLSSLVLSWRDY